MKVPIGEKIKKLRLASDLTQAELASRARLTRGFISQIENDQSSINIDSLADILEALGVGLGEFFSSDERRRIVFKASERVAVEDKGVRKFEIMIPGSTNNMMDPIMLEIAPGEFLDPRGPSPGEQFGYVLAGTVTLRVEGKTFKVPKDHCFYFESDQKNQIGNAGERTAKLLWVITPPQM